MSETALQASTVPGVTHGDERPTANGDAHGMQPTAASPYKINLSPDKRGNFNVSENDPTVTKKVNELLQKDLETFEDIYFAGRHNHIVHHILTAYALGATSEELQESFDRDASYQRIKPPPDPGIVEALSDKNKFKEYLDDCDNWTHYLAFFQKEIGTKGVKETLEEHLFAGDDHANRMLVRWFASIFHPVIHLGYALEYDQPAFVAEALAMAAIHESNNADLSNFLLASEKAAGGSNSPGEKSLLEILREARADEHLRDSYRKGTEVELIKNTARHGLSGAVRYAGQYSISPEQVDERFLEMVDVMSCAMINIPDTWESYKPDFFLIHAVNMLPMWPSLLNHPWLPKQRATRLLEWMNRYNVLLYLAEMSPGLRPDDLKKYKRDPRSWTELYELSIKHRTDDGHLPKAVRALAWAERFMKDAPNKDQRLMQDGMWLKLANLIVDTVPDHEDPTVRWLYPALELGIVPPP